MATTDELLKAKLKDLIAQRDAAMAALAPHRDAINKAHEKIQAIKDSIIPDATAIRNATPALKKIELELSKIARALGGKAMSDV